MSNEVQTTPMDSLKKEIWGAQNQFQKMSSELDFAKEAMFAWQQLCKTDYAMKCAMNDREAVRFAVLNVAAIGLTLNPAQALAYLVPRGGKICLDVSYRGMVKLATDTGAIRAVNAQLVYQKDSFEYLGPFEAPKHVANYFGDRGELVGVYVVAKLSDGTVLAETPMSIQEIYTIRDRTEAWKAFTSGKTKSCPWFTDEGEMIKKTAIKRASKMWPKTEALAQAVELVNEHEGIDFKKEQGQVVHEPADMAKRVDEFNAVFDEIKAICNELTAGMSLVQKADFLEDAVGVSNLDDLKKATPTFLDKAVSELRARNQPPQMPPAPEETEEDIVSRLKGEKK